MSAPTRRRVEPGIYVLASGEYAAIVKRNGRQSQRNLGLVPLSEARIGRDRLIRELDAPPAVQVGPRVSFAEAYRQRADRIGGACPIEAGLLGRLADNECRHGRLPFDKSPVCGCFPQEGAAVRQLPIRHDHAEEVAA